MSETYLLGIDNGGTVAKAALFTLDGSEVSVAGHKNAVFTPHPGWAEFDADRLWQATAAAIRKVLASAQVDPHRVKGVACTGHGNGLYLIDAAGKPVRPAIFSSDARARSYVERWTTEGVFQRVAPKTLQTLWPGQPNALLAWLADHEPDSLVRTRWALMCKDFIRFRLTGNVHGELTDMSGTSLVNVVTGQYDAEILEAFGIAGLADKLPPLCQSADVCGQVTRAAAAETGLAEGTPVAGGMFDIDACALASALLDEDSLGMTLGTWGINQYVSQTPPPPGAVFMTSRYCNPGYFLMLEGSATSASNLEWFIAQLLPREAEEARTHGRNIYDLINGWVGQTPADDAGLLFLPFLYGSNVAVDATSCLVGLSQRHQLGHVLRAVYEGVVFSHMTHFERLMRIRARPTAIRATGGAARSPVWMQMLADALQLPVELPAGSELGARGTALSAGVAIGGYRDFEDACRRTVRWASRYEPDARRGEIYQAKYARYRRFLDALQDAWADLAWR